MDELDRLIISELQEARSLTPKVTNIAKKLKKSTTTVHMRIKRLERAGVIRGYSAVIDPDRLGKKLNAFYFIKTTRGKQPYMGDVIAEKLVKYPGVKSVYNTMGEWDLVVEFVGKDPDEYVEFMRHVEPMDGVRETKGKSILKIYESKFKLLP